MNIVPFESTLPAHIQALETDADDLSAGVSSGFPILSIKGKNFHIHRGEDAQLVTLPGTEDPASSIQVVILKANKHISKIFYAKKYVEGSQEKPDCHSSDGITPAEDAPNRQSKTCATCPNNVWGSRMTEDGKKAKACSDARRIAVAPVGQLNDPMLLRVPATSLRELAEYGDLLKKRGVKYPSVVTKIKFDTSQAYPALQFQPVGFLDAEGVETVKEMLASTVVQQIIGGSESSQPVVQPTSPKLPEKAEAAETKPEPAAAPAAPEKPKAEKKATKPAVVVETDKSFEDELEAALASAGLDDA